MAARLLQLVVTLDCLPGHSDLPHATGTCNKFCHTELLRLLSIGAEAYARDLTSHMS